VTLVLAIGYRPTWRQWLPAVLIPTLLVAPHMIYGQLHHGNPWQALDIHARYYRNHELVGTPGGFAPDRLDHEIYGGTAISTTAYLFDRPSTQLWTYYAHGLRDLLAGRMAQRYYTSARLRQYCCWLGLALWLGSQRGRRLLLALLALWGPMPFIITATVQLDPRLAYQAAPLLELAAASALVTLAQPCIGTMSRADSAARGRNQGAPD
jgi:hypothetical protein